MALQVSGVQLVVQGTSQFVNNLRLAGQSLTTLTRNMTASPVNTFSAAITGLGAAFGRIVTTALGIGLYQLSAAALNLIPTIEELTLQYSYQQVQLTSLLAMEEANKKGLTDISSEMAAAAPIAAELFQQYQRLAILSPFKTSDIITARTILQSYDMTSERLKELVPRLVDVGTLRGWTGKKLEEAALAFGQVATAGRLMGTEARQLIDKAIPAYKLVADYLGITTEQARELGKDGKISADLFFDAFMAWSAPAAGAAERFAHTLPGLVSSFEDLREINLREFGVGFGDAILPVLDQLVTWMNNPSTQQFFHNLGTQVGEAVVAFAEWGQTVYAAFGYWQNGIISLQTFMDVILPGLGDAFAPVLQPLQDLAGWIGEHLPAAMDFLSEHSTELQGALMGVGALFLGGLGISVVLGLLGALVSPVGLLIEAAALLGAAWAGNWGNIQGIVAGAWAVIQPILAEAYNWLVTNIPAAVSTASEVWTGTLQPALQKVAGFIDSTVVPALSSAASWLQSNLPGAVDATSGAINGTLIPALSSATNWLGGQLTSAASSVTDFWNGQLGPAFNAVGQLINATTIPYLTVLANTMTGLVGPAASILAAVWNGVLLPALTTVGNLITTMILPTLASLANVGLAVVQKAAELLAAVFTNVVNPALQNAATAASNYLGPAISALEPVFQTVGGVADWFGSSVLGPLVGWFENIQDAARGLIGYLNEIADAIRSIEIPAWARGKSPPPLAKWFDFISESIEYAATEALPAFQEAFAGMSEDIMKQSKDVKDAILDMMEAQYSAAADVNRQQAKNIDSLGDLSEAQQKYVKDQISGANVIASQMTDPAQAAKYFQIRSQQAFEIAKLWDKYNKENDAKKKQAIADQINLLEQAQGYELQALDIKNSQNNPLADLLQLLTGDKGLLTGVPIFGSGGAGAGLFQFAQYLQDIMSKLGTGPLGSTYFPDIMSQQANTQGLLATTNSSTYAPVYHYAPTYSGAPQSPQYDFEIMRSIRR